MDWRSDVGGLSMKRAVFLMVIALLGIVPRVGGITLSEATPPSGSAGISLSVRVAPRADPGPPPLLIPEDLYHYHFGWNGIPAFDGSIQATRHNDVRPWYHFRLQGGTRRWIDLFYKMRDSMDAYVDGVDYLPLVFFVQMRAPREKTDLMVKFDNRIGVAHAHWVENGRPRDREIPFHHANDPVTVMYLIEKLRAPGDAASFEVVNGHANYQVGLRVVGRERVRVKAGTFDTLVIEPTLTRLDKPRYRPKFKRMTVWVTDGETRIPVKLRSEIFIGSVTGELVGITPRTSRTATRG